MQFTAFSDDVILHENEQNSQFQYENVNSDNLPVLLELYESDTSNVIEPPVPTWLKYVENNAHIHSYVIYVQGVALGHIQLDELDEGESAMLLFIEEGQRQKGYGTALLVDFLTRLQNNTTLKSVIGYMDPADDTSIRFAENCHFTNVGYDEEHDMLIYMIRLR